MNNSVLHWINNPLSVSSKDLFSLEDEIEKYPYFQVLHLLKAKVVSNSEEKTFATVLGKTAIYCSSRRILFEYLNKEKIAIDENISDKISIEKTVSDPEPIQDLIQQKNPSEEFEETRESEVSQLLEAHQKSNIDERTETFNKTLDASDTDSVSSLNPQEIKVKSSFNHWLKKNQNLSTSEENEIESINEKFKVIEDFLDKNPKITPAKDFKPSIEISSHNNDNMSHLMTETLAKIYVEQNKYDKAIKAYTILRLKYPEKSGYFADLIKEIQELKHK